MQEIQLANQTEMQLKQAEHQMLVERMRLQAEIDKEQLQLKLTSQTISTQAMVSGKRGIEQMKEDRKDSRIDQQTENQSKLIEQRKNNTGTVDVQGNNSNAIAEILGE